MDRLHAIQEAQKEQHILSSLLSKILHLKSK